MAEKYVEKSNLRFNKMMTTSFISCIITAIFGLFLFLASDLTNKIIGIFVGVVALIMGITYLYKYIKREGVKLFSFNILFGILLIILSIIIFIMPLVVTQTVTLFLGLFMIIIGSNKVTYGILFKGAGFKPWLLMLVTGLLLIVLGILAIVNPFANLTITKIVGIFLILSSILDFSNLVMLKKQSEELIDRFW